MTDRLSLTNALADAAMTKTSSAVKESVRHPAALASFFARTRKSEQKCQQEPHTRAGTRSKRHSG